MFSELKWLRLLTTFRKFAKSSVFLVDSVIVFLLHYSERSSASLKPGQLFCVSPNYVGVEIDLDNNEAQIKGYAYADEFYLFDKVYPPAYAVNLRDLHCIDELLDSEF